MEKKMRLLLQLALCITLLTACDKDDEDEKVPVSILVSKSWSPALTDKNKASNPPGGVLYSPVPDCQQDDVYNFGADGSLTISEGATKCDPDAPATKTVPYSYNKDTKELVIDGFSYTLAEESETQIKYYVPINPSTGYSYLVFLLQ